MTGIAGAPISWGVCEAPDWGVQLEPGVVLDELRRAGYAATEAGPDGWLPGDGAELRSALGVHGLELAGAFVPVHLTSRDAFLESFTVFERVLDRVEGSPGAVINLAVLGSESDYRGRVELEPAAWSATLSGLDELASLAASHGVTCVLHQHAGTAVERGEDLQRVLDGSGIGLCLDTGHLLLGGIDPLELARAATERIAHVHLKDVDADVADRWRAGEFASMREAVAAGVWRQLGAGDARVEDVLDVLRRGAYRGWYVLERDTSLDAGAADDAEQRVADAIREREWVEARIGAEVAR